MNEGRSGRTEKLLSQNKKTESTRCRNVSSDKILEPVKSTIRIVTNVMGNILYKTSIDILSYF